MGVMVRPARMLVVIAVPLALLLAPMHALITPAFVRHEYSRPGFPAASRFDAPERLDISDAILAYLRGRISREQLAAFRIASGDVALNQREVSHLADVRAVMDALFTVQGISTIVAFVPAAYLLARRQYAALGRALRLGVVVTAVLIGGIVLVALVDFGLFFTAFHGVFFESGTWTFEWTDTLIQLYPLPFWQDAVWKYGLLVAALLAAVTGVSVLVSRRGGAALEAATGDRSV